MKSFLYLSAVGSLLYLAIGTRPDIAYSVGLVCRFAKNPGMVHWQVVMRILKFLNTLQCMHSTMVLQCQIPNLLLHTFVSSLMLVLHKKNAHALQMNLLYSLEAIFIGDCLVSWGSKHQTVVATSSAEAEWIAANLAGREATWFRKVMREIGYPQDATPLHIDNKSAIKVGENGVMV